jgi:xylulokinase
VNAAHAATYLGIDLGTSGLKLTLVGGDGTVVAEAEETYELQAARPGYAEIDPHDWSRALDRCVDRLVQTPDGGRAGASVAAVGFSGQMHGVVLTAADGKPLRPAVLWPDQRASSVMGRWHDLAPEVRGGLSNPLVPGMAGPLLTWLNDHEPSLLGDARVASPKDWLRRQLTSDDAAGDRSDATATLLWDVVTDDWSTRAVELAGVTRSQLPVPVPSDTVVGTTRLLGGADVPVVAGAADTAAALVALERSDSGRLLREGGVVVNAGTGIQILRTGASPEVRVDPKTHLYGDASGGWYEMLAIQNGGLALDWAQVTLDASWDEAVGLAGATAPGASGATFLPFLTGERGGVAPLEPSAGWRHLSTATGRAELLRAAFEAYAFTIRRGLEVIDASDGPVLLTGGGGRDPFLRQLVADVLDRPVSFVNLRSVSAVGAAVLAARGVGADLDVPAAVVEVSPGDDQARGALDAAYERWTSLLDDSSLT